MIFEIVYRSGRVERKAVSGKDLSSFQRVMGQLMAAGSVIEFKKVKGRK